MALSIRIDDHFVANRCDAHLETGSNQRADHVCAGKGLARSRRALDGKHMSAELQCQPACSPQSVLSLVQ